VDEEPYSTCSCPECSGKVEFPAHGIGEEIECPHCQIPFALYDESEDSQQVGGSIDWHAETSPTPDTPQPPIIATEPEETDCTDIQLHRLPQCKTCYGTVAPSAEFCVHCGQKWPALNLRCPHCGANDFELFILEDTSSVMVTPSLVGIFSAALWEAMRDKPQLCMSCLNCGGDARLPG
jgi:hypothetical protein